MINDDRQIQRRLPSCTDTADMVDMADMVTVVVIQLQIAVMEWEETSH